MKKLLVGLLLVIVLLALAACSSSPNSTRSAPMPAPYTTMAAATPTATSYYSYSMGSGAPSLPQPSPTSGPDNSNVVFGTVDIPDPSSGSHMVVRTGNLELVVKSVPDAITGITKIAGDFGGYVVSSQQGKNGEMTTGNISIRVLAEDYDAAVAALHALAMDVLNETSSSQDVTQEYVDLGSQLKNLQATDAQLLKIMETATKTEDVLAIQTQLTNVEGQIEQTKGRMQYLEQTAATSLISIRLDETVIDIKFSADKVLTNTGDTITFTSEVTGGFPPYNYQWDFGDGNTSIESSPTHSYRSAGVYTVILKVTDDKGYTNTDSRSAYINITGSWNPGSIAGTAANGFIGFGHVFVDILIWLGIFSPIWIVILAIIWWRVWRKRKAA